MAANLVRSKVDVILAITTPAAIAAKAATTALPIVFEVGADPVKLELVASLSNPGGNLTGVSLLNVELGAKRLELLHGVVPSTTIFGLLINPKIPMPRPSHVDPGNKAKFILTRYRPGSAEPFATEVLFS